MTRSVAIVGAGQIGFAAARSFWMAGWDVQVLQRSAARWVLDVEYVNHTVGIDPSPLADVVVDSIAFDQDDVERYDPDKVGRLILISSASVYADDHGRTLDEAAQNGFPEFDGPIAEDQPTVPPGPDTYSTRKVRMENKALEMFGDRVTILRPCAIHGLWSRHLREWWFAKRLIDGRKRIPLANRGSSRFHTTSAKMIGDFALHAAERSLGGVFNLGDSDALSVMQIGKAIGSLFDANVEYVPVDGYPDGGVGRTPWSVPLPFIVSSAKAMRSGFRGVTEYTSSMPESVFYLKDDPPRDWRAAFLQLAAYPWDLFDYAAEDAFFEAL